MRHSSSLVVHRVLRLIQSDNPSFKLQAAGEIRRLAFFSRYQGLLSEAIEPLVSMLRVDWSECDSEFVLHTLIRLAINNETNCIKIVEVGALEPIISFLQSQSLYLKESATECLLFLSTPDINKPVIGSSGAIPLIVKILGDESQQAKMNAVRVLSKLSNDPNNLKIIQGTNPIPPIVDLLKKCDKLSEITEMCSALVESLVGFDEGRTAMTSVEGRILAIPLLVKILGHKSLKAKMNAMKALLKLSKDPNNLKIILGTNPIPPIVDLLKKCDKSSELTEMCSVLMESLVGFDEGRTVLTSEEGGMLAVVEVFEFGSPQCQEHALGVLLTMCQSDICKYRELIHREGVISELFRLILQGTRKSQVKAQILWWLQEDSSFPTIYRALLDDPKLKLQATEEIKQFITFDGFWGQLSGLIEPLISMLQANSPESHCESALVALVDLADIEEENKIKIVEYGALEPIISFLQSQSLKLQESATECLFILSTSVANKPIIGSSGAIPLLVKILGHESQQVKMKATKALLVLSEDPNNLNIILRANPIPLIVDFLKSDKRSSEQTEICSALIESLVGFDEGRTALASKEGGVLAVVEVLKNGSVQSQEHAVGVLLTMYQSDSSAYREPAIRDGIIPELEKLTVQGKPKSKLKAQMHLLLLRNSPYSQKVPRVTLYRLNDNGEWVDGRICYVTIDSLKGSNELGLFVVGEEDGGISLLQHISPNVIYRRLEDTLISWRDPKYSTGLSLRFQETIECSYIWDHICNVLNLDFNTSNTVILEWIFVIANFIFEIPSAVFDQLSSVRKPNYALTAMGMAFAAILVCVVELIYKGQRKRVMWRWRGRGKERNKGKGSSRIPWFYYPPPSDKRFGTFADIVGLGCAIVQFIVTAINYSFIYHNVDGPIKISVWPIMFTCGVLCSKFLEKQGKTHQN